MPPDREIAAYHEAGHAVVGIALGALFVSSKLLNGGDGQTRFRNPPDHPPYREALRCLAGPMAEARYTGLPVDDVIDGTDEMMTLGALERAGKSRAEAVEDARRLVDRYWSAIEAVARALVERGEVGAVGLMDALCRAMGQQECSEESASAWVGPC